MRYFLIFFSLLCLKTQADDLVHQVVHEDNPDVTLTHFSYGACWKSSHSQKHWPAIIANKPQFWLWLGDNMYGDSEDVSVLKKKYSELANTEGYRKLAAISPVIATWDDHDYGANDAGAEFPIKKESEQLFLDFFNEPADSARRKREGVYTSYYFGKEDQRVQLIVLDTRYFRSPLKRIEGKPPYRRMGKWTPDNSPDATMLGAEQWKWLESELSKPARIRFIATSIQFSAPFHGYETWENMPLEKHRMIDLIVKTKAEGVVFLSGDIHSSEMCIEEPEGCYPLVDFTSSSLNVPLGIHPTHRRVGPAFGGANFALVNIDWEQSDPLITISTRDTNNQARLQHSIKLSELTFEQKNITPHPPHKNLAGEWATFFGPLTLTKNNDDTWKGTCAERTLELIETPKGLSGTWDGPNGKGKVIFYLTRCGRFLKGEYSNGNLPLQLDWAGWRPSWEQFFKRDDYHIKLRK